MHHDSMQFDSPLPVVHAWQEAANRLDEDRLLELSGSDIEIAGPRGTGKGQQVVLDWIARTKITLQTLRAFVRDETVVLAQHGIWRSPAVDGEPQSEGDIATRYLVSDGQVIWIERYNTLAEALQAAGLDSHDEMAEW